MSDKRFVEVFSEGGALTTKRTILLDRETGVQYLWVVSGYAGGLTPLLNADGSPAVSRAGSLRDLER